VPLFFVVASIGVVMPNATALALADHPDVAGSASALVGVLQFAVGAAAAPLVGVAGNDTALPMAVMIAVLGLGGISAMLLLTRARASYAAAGTPTGD
jgi:DHA1 family bicyclomycin/chloramphenicol resistance-like MFS transporter